MKNHETTLKNHGSDDFLLQTDKQTLHHYIYIIIFVIIIIICWRDTDFGEVAEGLFTRSEEA